MGYGPNEGYGEEKERFWNSLDRVVDRVDNGYRLCVQGALNRWVRERVRVDITGCFGVQG